MLTLLRLDARTIIFYLEPGAMLLHSATDLNPAVAVAGGVNHHIGNRTLDRQRVHLHLNAARQQRSFDFTFVAAFCRHHFTQHRVQICHLHWHLLTGTQVIDELLDDGVTLFDVLIDGLRKITVLFAHHFRRQTNTRQRGT